MKPNRLRQLVGSAAILLLASGCSESGVSSVKGQVFYNGEPLSGAELEFRPEADLTLGSFGGQTDAEGRFDVKIGKGTGMNAKPGRYVVLITKGKLLGSPPVDASSEEEHVKGLMEAQAGRPGSGSTGLLPLRYADSATTPFKVAVAAGVNDLEPFRLEGPPLK